MKILDSGSGLKYLVRKIEVVNLVLAVLVSAFSFPKMTRRSARVVVYLAVSLLQWAQVMMRSVASARMIMSLLAKLGEHPWPLWMASISVVGDMVRLWLVPPVSSFL